MMESVSANSRLRSRELARMDYWSTSQAVSLALFIAVSVYFIIIHIRGRKKA